MLLKPHRSLAQLRVRLINCWMSALKAKVSAMAAKVLPGSRISAFFLRSQSFVIHPFEPPKANCGSHTTFGAKMTGDEWAGSRSRHVFQLQLANSKWLSNFKPMKFYLSSHMLLSLSVLSVQILGWATW